jgi:hypothetical protein
VAEGFLELPVAANPVQGGQRWPELLIGSEVRAVYLLMSRCRFVACGHRS